MLEHRKKTAAIPPNSHSLAVHSVADIAAVLERATAALARAESFGAIKEVISEAKLVRRWARIMGCDIEIQNRATELVLRAERRAGEMLQALPLRGGDRRSGIGSARPRLHDLGITQNQSTRWQAVASIPATEFRRFLAEFRGSGAKLTKKSLMRFIGVPRGSNCSRRSAPDACVNTAAVGAVRNLDSHEELITESLNHCRIMGMILMPVLDECRPIRLHAEEKMHLRRIIPELIALLSQLEAQTKAD